jgi:hypothetical protein
MRTKTVNEKDRALLIARACEAYALERWALFTRLSHRLDEHGRRELARALYVS